MKIRLQPYKRGSRSAKVLSQTCGLLRTTANQLRRHRDFDIVINWGSSERLPQARAYLNPPEACVRAADKLESLQALSAAGVPCPEFTTDRGTARGWYDDGASVVCRTLTRGNSGRGIVLCDPNANVRGGAELGEAYVEANNAGGGYGARQNTAARTGRGAGPSVTSEPPVAAPLYTKYVKKADEYRVHVFQGRVLDIQQKRKRQEVNNDDVNYQIRNADNGWVYCRENVDCPPSVTDAAVNAVAALGLDFGAVDVGYNQHSALPCVYEVNTAPGLEGTTLDRYYYALLEAYPSLANRAYQRRRQAA